MGVACAWGKFCHATPAFCTASWTEKLSRTLKEGGNLSVFLTAEPSNSFLKGEKKEVKNFAKILVLMAIKIYLHQNYYTGYMYM